MFRKTTHLFTILLVLVIASLGHGQSLRITGTLLDADDETPLSQAKVAVSGTFNETLSDADGKFALELDPTTVVNISISDALHETMNVTVQPVGEVHDMGTLYISKSSDEAQVNVPTIVLNEQEVGDEDNGAEDVSGLLSASRDPFAQAASFDFSWARFRMRGLASSSSEMTMNGILTNDLETGSVRWSLWSGLNDAVRARRDVINIDISGLAFGGLGGSANIDIRPSKMRRYTRVSYASSNGNYRHRLMGFYNSGLNEKGWGLALSASRRYAEEGYQEGTFYDAWSYFISIEKRINDKHSLNLASFSANSKRGRNSAVTQEEYDLRDKDLYELYNPNWGYQNGEKRSGRITTTAQPVFILSHDWKINDNLKLTTGGLYRFGRYGNKRLDWNNAADPRPNYYRYLPSWQTDETLRDAVTQQWRTDENTRQIDWNRMYQINYRATETIRDVNGVAGNDVTGLRSRFIIEEQRFDPTTLSLSSTLNAIISPNFQLYASVTHMNSRTENYKLVDDLLGGEFVLDVDKFAESDFVLPGQPTPDIIQSDLNNPTRLVREGDTYGYNYNIETRLTKGWLQGKYETRKVVAYLGGQVGAASFWRDGKYQNGIFPNNSLGESEKNESTIYGIKGGLTFKIDGRNFISVNGMMGQDPAIAREGFLSPRVNNFLNPYNTERPYRGFDANYQIRSPFVKARVSVFRNDFEDWVDNIQFYNDFRNSFGSWVLGNIDFRTEGVEAAFEVKLFPTLSAQGAATLMHNRYTSRQVATVIDDRATEYNITDEIIYTDGYKLSGSPNTAANLGLTYRSPKFWWLGIKGNYFADNYLSISPTRRRTEAVDLLDVNSEEYQYILGQEKLDDEVVVNLVGGYSYRIKHGQYIRLFVSVTNLLDVRDYRSGGFEQLRFSSEDIDRFPSRYYYNYGRTYFASITYQF